MHPWLERALHSPNQQCLILVGNIHLLFLPLLDVSPSSPLSHQRRSLTPRVSHNIYIKGPFPGEALVFCMSIFIQKRRNKSKEKKSTLFNKQIKHILLKLATHFFLLLANFIDSLLVCFWSNIAITFDFFVGFSSFFVWLFTFTTLKDLIPCPVFSGSFNKMCFWEKLENH